MIGPDRKTQRDHQKSTKTMMSQATVGSMSG